MSPLTEPTRLVLARDYTRPDDSDAVAYIAAVEAADGQALETATRMAINSFVKGCKADGIWPAIKASCILAGARTLNGALVPLVGAAPTNVGGLFVSDDYNRKTGLIGNGSTKYINSNRAGNADPQNSVHLAVYASQATTSTSSGSNAFPVYIGNGSTEAGSTHIGRLNGNGNFYIRNRSFSSVSSANASSTGLIGASRSSAAEFVFRVAGANAVIALASQSAASSSCGVFRTISASPTNDSSTYANARLAFYSIGEALDLALLDARVTDLINAFATAIP